MTTTASSANDDTAASSIRCPVTISFVIPVSAMTSGGIGSKVRTQSGPPNDSGSQIDSGEEVSGELVIAGRNSAPVLEPAKHALDEVALLVCSAVEVME